MILTQDEVLTSGFWAIDCEGDFEVNAYSLGDEWNGFYLSEGRYLGTLWITMDYSWYWVWWWLVLMDGLPRIIGEEKNDISQHGRLMV